MNIWEVELALSEFPDSKELELWYDGVKVEFEIDTTGDNPVIRVY